MGFAWSAIFDSTINAILSARQVATRKQSENVVQAAEHGSLALLVRGFAPYALICVVIIAIYWRNVSFDYSFLDDDVLIRNKLDFFRSPGSLWQIFKQDVFLDGQSAFYRPLQVFSYLVDAQLSPASLRSFFITNICLHMLQCMLLYRLLRDTVGNCRYNLALVTFYAVNPLFVHALSWLPARGELLLGVLATSAVILVIRMVKTGRFALLAPVAFCLLLCFLTKESAIGLPILLVFLVLSSGKEKRKQQLFAMITITVLNLATYFILRWNAVELKATGSAFDLSNIFLNLQAAPEMLTKFLVPILLSPMPRYHIILVVSGSCLLAIIVFLIAKFRLLKSPVVWFAVLWAGLFLLPTLTFNQSFSAVSYQYLEHRAYVPFIGLILLLGFMLSHYTPRSRFQFFPIFIFVAGFGVYSTVYSQNYRDAEAFFARVLALNPADPVAYFNRGNARHRANKLDGALEDYRRALTLNPAYASAANNLGILYSERGEFIQAVDVLTSGLQYHPQDTRLAFNRGIAELQLGHIRTGCQDLQNARSLGSVDSIEIIRKYCNPEMIKKYERP